VGAADFYDWLELGCLLRQGAVQMGQPRQQAVFDLERGGDMHGGREGVVGRLAAVDVVVGVNRRLVAALATENFVGAVGDDLVGVHVGLRAGAGLPHHQRKIIVEFTVDDFLRRLIDRLGDLFFQLAERQIGPRGGLFLDAERAYQRQRHTLVADGEVLHAALGLGAPVFIGRNLDLAHGVGFDANVTRHIWVSLVVARIIVVTARR
jgi:hypothetical protein